VAITAMVACMLDVATSDMLLYKSGEGPTIIATEIRRSLEFFYSCIKTPL
jgi:hypothetical protein